MFDVGLLVCDFGLSLSQLGPGILAPGEVDRVFFTSLLLNIEGALFTQLDKALKKL